MESNIMKTAADFIDATAGGAIGDADKNNHAGNNLIMDFLKNRFSSDTRYKEITNFLTSSNELIVKLEHIPNRESLTEEQFLVEK